MSNFTEQEFSAIVNVGRIEQVKYTGAGVPMKRFSGAVNSSYKDAQGNQQETTEWFPFVCFGKIAEIADKYVEQGDHLRVRGKIANRQYEVDASDKEGKPVVTQSGERFTITRYTYDIKVDRLGFLGRRKNSGQSDVPTDIAENDFRIPEGLPAT
jgi:single-strand DNA-binding protein